MKKLNTGVVITYDKKGSIESVYSPYWVDEPKESLSKRLWKILTEYTFTI